MFDYDSDSQQQEIDVITGAKHVLSHLDFMSRQNYHILKREAINNQSISKE